MAGLDPILSLRLHAKDEIETLSNRTVILRAPDYTCRIGRGSRSGGPELFPSEANALFDSRVMSREHARVEADPTTKQIYVQDVGSMHGTTLNGRAVTPFRRESLMSDDLLRFGAEVTRGAESFAPLELRTSFVWTTEVTASPNNPFKPLLPERRSNTFSVPDLSDEDHYGDSDLEYLGESSVRISQIGSVACPSRTFSVPDSDDSEIQSVASEEHDVEVHTSPSSPTSLNDAEKNAVTTLANRAAHDACPQLQRPGIDSTTATVSLPPLTGDDYSEESDIEREHSMYEDGFSDVEDAPVPFDSHQHEVSRSSMTQNTVEAQNTSAPYRAPSPSDAAMAKAAPPASSQAYHQTSDARPGANMSSIQHWPPIAARSSWLQAGIPRPDPLSLAPLHVERIDLSTPPLGTQSWTGPSFDTVYGQPQWNQQREPPNLPFTSSTLEGYPLQHQENYSFAKHALSPDSAIKRKESTPAALTEKKASTQPPTPARSVQSTHLKRKAEHMLEGQESDDTGGTSHGVMTTSVPIATAATKDFCQLSEALMLGIDPVLDHMTHGLAINTATGPESVVVVQTDATEVQEHPTKRVKTGEKGPKKQSGSAMKYAATALAGVAVGAIGAIWGLVALPEDFFL